MPTSRDIKLLNSATNYLLDVKPYHTKLRSLVSELFFEDRMTVIFDERLFFKVDLQGVWNRNSLGGWRLEDTSDGSEASRRYRIPATIFTHFSITDSLDQGQTPVGNDPAIIDQTNVNPDGPNPNAAPWDTVASIPDVHIPWAPPTAVANPTAPGGIDQGGWSHQIAGLDDVETGPNCGWFPVPWHHGSRVYVDGVQQEFGVDYYVDKNRGFIKFTSVGVGFGQHPDSNGIPAPGAEILINYFRSDRFFISVNTPFEWNISTTYDDHRYDIPYYDSLFSFSESLSDQFTLTVDFSAPSNHTVTFYNVSPGSIKGRLNPSAVGSLATDGDVWTITATGPSTFAVQKIFPTTGAVDIAYYGIPFDNGEISFTITNTWVDYYLAVNDTNEPNTYAVYDLDIFDVFFLDDAPDSSDFLANLDLRTEHGVVTDPLPTRHSPVQFQPWGYITKVTETTLVGDQDFYQFIFNDIPEVGSFIQFQVEQVGTYNIPAHVGMDEAPELELLTLLAPGMEDQPLDGWALSGDDALNFVIGYGSALLGGDTTFDTDDYDDGEIFGPTSPIAGGANVGDGTLELNVVYAEPLPYLGIYQSVYQNTVIYGERWVITFTSATTFDVEGEEFNLGDPVSGIQASGTVGVPYDNGIVSFTITAGGTPFVAGDTFTFDVDSSIFDSLVPPFYWTGFTPNNPANYADQRGSITAPFEELAVVTGGTVVATYAPLVTTTPPQSTLSVYDITDPLNEVELIVAAGTPADGEVQVSGTTLTFNAAQEGVPVRITYNFATPIYNTSVQETWIVTLTSSSTFTVTGSVSGPQAAGTVDVPYNNGIISFTLSSGALLQQNALDRIAFAPAPFPAYPTPGGMTVPDAGVAFEAGDEFVMIVFNTTVTL